MSKLKKFENFNDDELFELEDEPKEISYNQAFNDYIELQNISGEYGTQINGSYPYAYGIVCENGYKLLHHGGGCSGDDCNTSWILDPNDRVIAKYDW